MRLKSIVLPGIYFVSYLAQHKINITLIIPGVVILVNNECIMTMALEFRIPPDTAGLVFRTSDPLKNMYRAFRSDDTSIRR